MTNFFAFVTPLYFVLFVTAYYSVVLVKDDERVVTLRVGKFNRVMAPGIRFILPGLDKVYRVKLPEHVPDWQSLSPSALEARVKDIVLNDPEPKRFFNA